jgi:membrane-associated phospholipid phosphatase
VVRDIDVRDWRKKAADDRYTEAQGVTHPTNGEEGLYNGLFIANYSKSLPHNPMGEVDPAAYVKIRDACNNSINTTPTTFNESLFSNIDKGTIPPGKCYHKLTNPISGLAYDIEGQDSHGLSVNPPPRIDSEAGAADILEVYWMALCRDIDFKDYGQNSQIQDAVNSLNPFAAHIRPNDSTPSLSRGNIFRGNFKGDDVGPFVSQLLLKGNKDDVLNRKETDGYIKFGAGSYDQRIVVGLKNKDYMTHFDSWLAVQNGDDRNLSLIVNHDLNPCKEMTDTRDLDDYYDTTPRFIHNMRALASWVHFDKLYQAYLDALIYLQRLPRKETKDHPLLDPGNPYNGNMNQMGFGTFGDPHVQTLVTEVATRALKAAWFQKWFVHRRLRPEAFGGLIHLCKTGQKNYPVNGKILSSDVLGKIAELNKEQNEKYGRRDTNPAQNGDYYLLPMAFPEGSPTHPSFPAGHATVAGACVTVLKAWFNEEYPIKNPVHAIKGGTELDYYNGPGKDNLTLGGELNKLAANIAIGRNMAGVHYRTDYVESVKLGEKVAISVLKDQMETYFEKYKLTLKREYLFGDSPIDLEIKNH